MSVLDKHRWQAISPWLDRLLDVEAPMQWVLFRLSAEQWVDEERWHALFEEHVGHHWCFHHEPPPEPTEARDVKRFYEPYATRSPRALATSAAVSWVDEMPTTRYARGVSVHRVTVKL